jgi:hypothetical protein
MVAFAGRPWANSLTVDRSTLPFSERLLPMMSLFRSASMSAFRCLADFAQ